MAPDIGASWMGSPRPVATSRSGSPTTHSTPGGLHASDLTGRRTPDCARVPALIEQLEDPVASVSADGAYDTAGVYEAAQGRVTDTQ